MQTGFPRSVATKNVLELRCTVLLNASLSQPGVIHLVSTSFSNLPSHQVLMINSHGRAWTLDNLIKKKNYTEIHKNANHIAEIREECSNLGAEYLLNYDLGRQTAGGGEEGREGKREAESESISLTKKAMETQKSLGFSILSI